MEAFLCLNGQSTRSGAISTSTPALWTLVGTCQCCSLESKLLLTKGTEETHFLVNRWLGYISYQEDPEPQTVATTWEIYTTKSLGKTGWGATYIYTLWLLDTRAGCGIKTNIHGLAVQRMCCFQTTPPQLAQCGRTATVPLDTKRPAHGAVRLTVWMTETGEFYKHESTGKLHCLEIISIGRTIIIWSPMQLKIHFEVPRWWFCFRQGGQTCKSSTNRAWTFRDGSHPVSPGLQVRTTHALLGKGRGCGQAITETYKLSLPCPHGNVFLFWGCSLVGLGTTQKRLTFSCAHTRGAVPKSLSLARYCHQFAGVWIPHAWLTLNKRGGTTPGSSPFREREQV